MPVALNGANEARRDVAQGLTGHRLLSIDRGVAITFLLLMLMGLMVLYAASYYNAQDSGNALSEVYSQLVGIAVGAVGMAFMLRIDYRRLRQPWVCGGLLD